MFQIRFEGFGKCKNAFNITFNKSLSDVFQVKKLPLQQNMSTSPKGRNSPVAEEVYLAPDDSH